MRKILYADIDALDDYVSEIDGYVTDEAMIEETTISNKNVGVSAFKIDGMLGKNNTQTLKQQMKVNVAGKLDKVIRYLKDTDDLAYYDDIPDDVFNSMSRDEYYEFTVNGRLSKFQSTINMANDLVGVSQFLTSSLPLDSNTKDAITGISKLAEKDTLTCIFEFESGQYPIIATINKNFLKYDVEEFLNKPVDILCKIKKVHPVGAKVKVDEILEKYTNNMNRSLRRSTKGSLSNPPEIKDEIKGPALTVSILAIYE